MSIGSMEDERPARLAQTLVRDGRDARPPSKQKGRLSGGFYCCPWIGLLRRLFFGFLRCCGSMRFGLPEIRVGLDPFVPGIAHGRSEREQIVLAELDRSGQQLAKLLHAVF